MSPLTIRFLKASLFYFALAGLLGLSFFLVPTLVGEFKFMHTHFNLLGWMSMMIYGVGYHILPRFRGKPLYSDKLGDIQFWVANIGLVVMTVAKAISLSVTGAALWTGIAIVGAFISVAGVLIFVLNLWKTIE